MSQIERRFIVKAVAHPPTKPWPREAHILQGYWDTPEYDILRVRITDDRKAELVRKVGTGIERSPESRHIDVETATWLYRTCPYRIEKTRLRTDDGWKIDTFIVPSGLIVIEKSLSAADEEVVMPAWAIDPVEVTSTVNNLHIAKLASVQDGHPIPASWPPPAVKKAVLTGGPCSGKTTAVERLAGSPLASGIHFVPEVATIVIGQVGAMPPLTDPIANAEFQQRIYRVQTTFEELSGAEAARTGKPLMLLDRGRKDGEAYLGGEERFCRVMRTTPYEEFSRYARVLHLAVPPKDVYDANKANNPSRKETWEEAKALEEGIRKTWEGHPRYVFIDGDMDVKYAQVLALLQ